MKGMGFEDPFIHELLFAGFDADRDGVVTFKEFITALSTLTRGSPDEKIECTLFQAQKGPFLETYNFLTSLVSHIPHV
jgi:Ca2+-binding EF-hand superfamily protein